MHNGDAKLKVKSDAKNLHSLGINQRTYQLSIINYFGLKWPILHAL